MATLTGRMVSSRDRGLHLTVLGIGGRMGVSTVELGAVGLSLKMQLQMRRQPQVESLHEGSGRGLKGLVD